MYGYIDPAERVHQQQALRALARPQAPLQPVAFYQPQPEYGPLNGVETSFVETAPEYRSGVGEAVVMLALAAVVVVVVIAVAKGAMWAFRAIARKTSKGRHATR